MYPCRTSKIPSTTTTLCSYYYNVIEKQVNILNVAERVRNKSTEKIPGPPRIGTQDLLKIVRPLLQLRLLDPCGKTSYILVLSSIALGSDSISIKRKKVDGGKAREQGYSPAFYFTK